MRLTVTALLLLLLKSCESQSTCLDECSCDFGDPATLTCTLIGSHSVLPDVPSLNYTFKTIILQGSMNESLNIPEIGAYAFTNWRTESLILQYIQVGTFSQFAFFNNRVITSLELGHMNIDNLDRVFKTMGSLLQLKITNAIISDLNFGWFEGIFHLPVLTLTHNTISSIQRDLLAAAGSLNKLVLIGNNLTDISGLGLKYLTMLTELTLSNDPLTFIPPSTFNSKTLMSINLDSTLLTTLPCNAFGAQPSQPLNVSLQSSGITDLATLLASGFDNNSNYCWPKNVSRISLRDNRIAAWPKATEFNFSSVPDNLLDLSDNPLSCDCDMASGRRDFSRVVIDSLEQSCSSPLTVAGKQVLCYDPRLVPCPTLAQACDYDPTDFAACAAIDSQVRFPFNTPLNNISAIVPLVGSADGGTKVYVYGSGFNSLSIKSVHFGDQLVGQADNGLSTNDRINITTSKSIILDQPLPISFEYCNGAVLNTGYNFTFKNLKPIITGVYPTEHLISGGTRMNLNVSNLDSIQTQPTLQLTLTFIDGQITTITEKCSMNVSISLVLCTVPAFNLLSPFNISVSFKFDEFVVAPSTEITFYPPPAFNRQLIRFDPTTTDNVTVTGQNLLQGCQQSDYSVSIGIAPCQIVSLSDSELTCKPPSSSPIEADNSNCSENQRTLTIKIGYATFQPACIEYLKLVTTTSASNPSASTITSSIAYTVAAAATETTAFGSFATTIGSSDGTNKKISQNKKLRRCNIRNRNMRRRLYCLRRWQRRIKKMKG